MASGYRMVTCPMTSRDLKRSRSWPQYVWGQISQKPLETETWLQRNTNRKWPMASHVTLKGKGRDPTAICFGAVSSSSAPTKRFVVTCAPSLHPIISLLLSPSTPNSSPPLPFPPPLSLPSPCPSHPPMPLCSSPAPSLLGSPYLLLPLLPCVIVLWLAEHLTQTMTGILVLRFNFKNVANSSRL